MIIQKAKCHQNELKEFTSGLRKRFRCYKIDTVAQFEQKLKGQNDHQRSNLYQNVVELFSGHIYSQTAYLARNSLCHKWFIFQRTSWDQQNRSRKTRFALSHIVLKETLRFIVYNKPPRTKASRVLDVLAGHKDFDRCTRLTGNDCILCCEHLSRHKDLKSYTLQTEPRRLLSWLNLGFIFSSSSLL